MTDLIEAMSAPAFYPECPERVERRETHTAFVFLAGNHACQAAKNEVIRRLIERDRHADDISDANVDVYLAQLEEFEQLTEILSTWHLISNGGEAQGYPSVLDEVERRIFSPN